MDAGETCLSTDDPQRGDVMYPAGDARQLSIMLRIASELDIVGDVTATVDHPSDLLTWAALLSDPLVGAWRGVDSGMRYVQVSAPHQRDPVHGRVAAVLPCEHHREFWDQLVPAGDLQPGQECRLSVRDLSAAWAAMPLSPPDEGAGRDR